MAYLDIITLTQAKDYLGVDDSSRDNEITSMIKGALSYIERETSYIMDAQDIEYIYDDNNEVYVYDYPINTLDANLADSVTRTRKKMYSIYADTSTADSITLNVGANTIPNDLREAALIMIDFFFNEKETGNRMFTLDNTRIPIGAQTLIHKNKRFII